MLIKFRILKSWNFHLARKQWCGHEGVGVFGRLGSRSAPPKLKRTKKRSTFSCKSTKVMKVHFFNRLNKGHKGFYTIKYM